MCVDRVSATCCGQVVYPPFVQVVYPPFVAVCVDRVSISILLCAGCVYRYILPLSVCLCKSYVLLSLLFVFVLALGEHRHISGWVLPPPASALLGDQFLAAVTLVALRIVGCRIR